MPIAFQQTNRPVPVVYSLNTEFQLCNNEKVFMMDPAAADVSMADMDYKGAFSMGETLSNSNSKSVALFLVFFQLIRCVCSPCRPDSVWQGSVEPGAEPERRLPTAAGEGLPLHGQRRLRSLLRPHGDAVQRGAAVRLHPAQQEPEASFPAAGTGLFPHSILLQAFLFTPLRAEGLR